MSVERWKGGSVVSEGSVRGWGAKQRDEGLGYEGEAEDGRGGERAVRGLRGGEDLVVRGLITR